AEVGISTRQHRTHDPDEAITLSEGEGAVTLPCEETVMNEPNPGSTGASFAPPPPPRPPAPQTATRAPAPAVSNTPATASGDGPSTAEMARAAGILKVISDAYSAKMVGQERLRTSLLV